MGKGTGALLLLAGAGGLLYLVSRKKSDNGRPSEAACLAAWEAFAASPAAGLQDMTPEAIATVREMFLRHCRNAPPEAVHCFQNLDMSSEPPAECRAVLEPFGREVAEWIMAQMMMSEGAPVPGAQPPPPMPPPTMTMTGPDGQTVTMPVPQNGGSVPGQPPEVPAVNGLGNYVRGYLY